MQELGSVDTRHTNRRAFLKSGVLAGAATVSGAGGLLMGALPALAQEPRSGRLTQGDAAILRFLAAVEAIETDLWIQYNELGGEQNNEVPGQTGGSPPYRAALNNLDADMSQYIHDNTEDEISHFAFLDAYLKSKGAASVDLDEFRTLSSSKATGARQIGRLTNLMQLTVDTSWWVRYRSRANNPDLDPNFKFANAVPSLAMGQHPAIPRTDDDLTPQNHIQAIADTAAFHFGFIEQGGSSLYPSLAQRTSSREVLRILLSIGPTETSHFQTWHDKAGNAVSDPLAPLTDPKNPKLVFPNLNLLNSEDFQTNLIMPEPCPFLSRKFPRVSIIRPTNTTGSGAAVATIAAFTADGLFIGQSKEFFDTVRQLAREADEANVNEDNEDR
ncbi:MAG TPA: ferritin-like domain-containing protein [Gemmatimonadaceae bacterium]|jgi:hypothetical protein|nr:ferritin-like domain-containing protein [Gemmatimonadaceae bacterium]